MVRENNEWFFVHLSDHTAEMLPKIGNNDNLKAGIVHLQYKNEVWWFLKKGKVFSLNTKSRKLKLETPTLYDHCTPGCLITSDNKYLWVFSNLGIEKR